MVVSCTLLSHHSIKADYVNKLFSISGKIVLGSWHLLICWSAFLGNTCLLTWTLKWLHNQKTFSFYGTQGTCLGSTWLYSQKLQIFQSRGIYFCVEYRQWKISSNIGICTHICTYIFASNHRMAWVGSNPKDHLVPISLSWEGTPSTRPGCSELHPVWAQTPAGMRHQQLLGATWSSAK